VLPIQLSSQNLEHSLPKIIKFEGIEAVLLSLEQMDTISVKLIERKLFRQKNVTASYKIQSMVMEINMLKLEIDTKNKKLENKEGIIKQKDVQISLLNERLGLQEYNMPSWLEKIAEKALFALIGFAIGIGVAVGL